MKTDLLSYDYEPFAILEGGSGLSEDEETIYRRMVNGRYTVWAIDELYDHPARLASIQFLKPKTLIFGTTGVYKDKLAMLSELAESLDLSSVKRVVLTLDTRENIGKMLRLFSLKYPQIEFYELGYSDFRTEPIELIQVSI